MSATPYGLFLTAPETLELRELVLRPLERQYLDRLMRTHDASEGIAAFMERRPPQWRNA